MRISDWSSDVCSSDLLDVSGFILALQIVEHLAALIDHLQQATARVIVLLVLLEMRREHIDALRQQSNLHLGRARVILGAGMLAHHFRLAFNRQTHCLQLRPISLISTKSNILPFSTALLRVKNHGSCSSGNSTEERRVGKIVVISYRCGS